MHSVNSHHLWKEGKKRNILWEKVPMLQLGKLGQIHQNLTPNIALHVFLHLTNHAGFTNHSKPLRNRHVNKPVLVYHHVLGKTSQAVDSLTLPNCKGSLTQWLECNGIYRTHRTNQGDWLLCLHLIQMLNKQRWVKVNLHDLWSAKAITQCKICN